MRWHPCVLEWARESLSCSSGCESPWRRCVSSLQWLKPSSRGSNVAARDPQRQPAKAEIYNVRFILSSCALCSVPDVHAFLRQCHGGCGHVLGAPTRSDKLAVFPSSGSAPSRNTSTLR